MHIVLGHPNYNLKYPSRMFCLFVCLFVSVFVCLSEAFDHEGVELGSQFLVGNLMGIPKGAK